MLMSHITILECRIEAYMEQQSLFKMMRFDLEKYEKAYVISVEKETMYSPFTAHNQFKKEQIWTMEQQKSGLIDLSKSMS